MTIDEFSKFVFNKRKDTKLTFYEMAEKLGVSWVTVWRWENQYNMPKVDAINYWMDKINEL
jgi:transcriptional regulator with XRE-family HTH domain